MRFPPGFDVSSTPCLSCSAFRPWSSCPVMAFCSCPYPHKKAWVLRLQLLELQRPPHSTSHSHSSTTRAHSAWFQFWPKVWGRVWGTKDSGRKVQKLCWDGWRDLCGTMIETRRCSFLWLDNIRAGRVRCSICFPWKPLPCLLRWAPVGLYWRFCLETRRTLSQFLQKYRLRSWWDGWGHR